jgi:signal peptidase I
VTATLKKLWKNEYFQTAVVIGLILLVVAGFWFGSQFVLNTQYPLLAVESGSMCIPYGIACDDWTSLDHPFARTLHTGDLIIIQGVNPADLNADYPNSDIIIFHKPTNPEELIVHRIISKEEINGTLYFRTKGDGNGNKWPSIPQYGSDNWDGYPYGVPQDLVLGKVIMRVPWVGHVALLMRNSFGIPLVILVVVLLIFIEFILPLFQRKTQSHDEGETQPAKNESSL